METLHNLFQIIITKPTVVDKTYNFVKPLFNKKQSLINING